MKVTVVAPRPVPYTPGGAERAWNGLVAALREAGHEAELVTAPVPERTLAEVGRAYRTFSTLDVSDADVVISSKYPAWMVDHPRHVLWMFHPLRGLYDSYGAFGLPLVPGPVEPPTTDILTAVGGPARRDRVPEVLDALDTAIAVLGADHPDLAHPGPVARGVVHWLDRVALAPTAIARHVTLSRTIAARPEYLPRDVGARVAYAPSDVVPPPGDPSARRRHIFTASRLDGAKRMEMVVAAMAHVPGDVELLIGGTGPDEERLRAQAAGDPRIRFLGRVPDDELAALYAGALAVPFVPLEEDYGLITVEAMAAGAAVVTTTDSGGPAELITHGVDGLVVAPEPRVLGRALSALVSDPALATRLGEAGRVRGSRITWPAVVRTLLGPDPVPEEADPSAATASPVAISGTLARALAPVAPTPRRRPRRPRVVVLTTFRVAERGHGGQLRSFHLYGALARHVDVEVVSLVPDGTPTRERLGPGIVETTVPISVDHRRVTDEVTIALGTPMSDLMAGAAIERTPAYLARLREVARDADVALLAEPYLHPALAAAGVELPFVYDAFNVEADLKAASYPATHAGARALERIVSLEEEVCREAAAITACSREDADALARSVGRPRRDATVVPNGTDCGALVPPSPEERSRRGRLWLERYRELDPRVAAAQALALFLGSWHPPNLAGAEAIIELAAETGHVVFVLGGRHGDAFAGRRLPPNVVITGVVPSRAKDALLLSADVALNPVTTGSGTNLKVLEYLAAGTPVVTTPFGVRGLDVSDGHHLVVDDDLAVGIRRVLSDPEASVARSVAGRRLVEERYDWLALGDVMASVVRGVGG